MRTAISGILGDFVVVIGISVGVNAIVSAGVAVKYSVINVSVVIVSCCIMGSVVMGIGLRPNQIITLA